MSEEIIARRVLTRETADGFYVAEAQLVKLAGNARPYFSVTGEQWKSERHCRTGLERDQVCGGAMGEELARVFADVPGLALVERLHLADDTGAPMHALANGWYFYSGKAHEYERESRYHSEPTDTPHERSARTLRVEPAELPEGLDEEAFAAFVESLRPRWQEEADEALAFLREPGEPEPVQDERGEFAPFGAPITARVEAIGYALDANGWEHNAWKVTLRCEGRRMTVPFRTGLAIEGEPSARDVLEALLMDAASFDDADSFEGWAAEYGYGTDDPDERKQSERLYRKVERQTEGLRRLLGGAYEAAVFPQ